MEVFEMEYDNPNKKDGTPKENKKLGDFEIVKTIYDRGYSGKWVGISDGIKYLIYKIDVWNGFDTGSRFEVHRLDNSTQRPLYDAMCAILDKFFKGCKHIVL